MRRTGAVTPARRMTRRAWARDIAGAVPPFGQMIPFPRSFITRPQATVHQFAGHFGGEMVTVLGRKGLLGDYVDGGIEA